MKKLLITAFFLVNGMVYAQFPELNINTDKSRLNDGFIGEEHFTFKFSNNSITITDDYYKTSKVRYPMEMKSSGFNSEGVYYETLNFKGDTPNKSNKVGYIVYYTEKGGDVLVITEMVFDLDTTKEYYNSKHSHLFYNEENAKKKKLDAMMGGINNADGTATDGEENDNTAGDKGKITSDPNASGYYGNGGTGSGGDYQLGNRKPLSRPKPDYICDEEGLIVVRIEVDTDGKVIKATPGVKGSTNTAACLLSKAKEAALNTKWNPDSKAPSKQVGTIRYRFTLSQ